MGGRRQRKGARGVVGGGCCNKFAISLLRVMLRSVGALA